MREHDRVVRAPTRAIDPSGLADGRGWTAGQRNLPERASRPESERRSIRREERTRPIVAPRNRHRLELIERAQIELLMPAAHRAEHDRPAVGRQRDGRLARTALT